MFGSWGFDTSVTLCHDDSRSPRHRGSLNITAGATSKSMRTRSRLLEAAVEAFAGTGYAQSTMDDIANRAGVAHGTVYRYFANKEAVLYALLAERLTALAAEMH